MSVGVGSTIEKPVVRDYRYDEGDEERFAHYVDKSKIVDASVLGNALRAICGRVFVPQRDPSKFPVCPECKEIFDALPAK